MANKIHWYMIPLVGLTWITLSACQALDPGDVEPAELTPVSATDIAMNREDKIPYEQPMALVNVHSGRPNPSWSLTSEEAEEIIQIVLNLPQTSLASIAEGLGYRGFIVQLPEVNGEENVTLWVSQGAVKYESENTTLSFIDVDRRLERKLIDWSAAHVTPELHQLMLDNFE